jgi:hypothetical protein
MKQCRDCKHFDHKGTDEKTGMRYGMCKNWRFSVNENDARGCRRMERTEADERPE